MRKLFPVIAVTMLVLASLVSCGRSPAPASSSRARATDSLASERQRYASYCNASNEVLSAAESFRRDKSRDFSATSRRRAAALNEAASDFLQQPIDAATRNALNQLIKTTSRVVGAGAHHAAYDDVVGPAASFARAIQRVDQVFDDRCAK